jgi:hypothetical protein
MARTETSVLKTFEAARKTAVEAVAEEARRVLPDGWSIHLAVGWGMAVYDETRTTIMSDSTDPPARLPRGVRDLLKAAASLYDLFGPQNDCITNKGVSYPKPRKI